MRKWKTNLDYLIVIVLAAAAFLWLYGPSVLNPTNVDFLLSGANDLRQHYLGWVAYRNSPWRFPFIGMSNQLTWNDWQSVIFTDSIPLYAVFFKILSPLLPEPFQYFGLYALISNSRVCW